VLAAIAVDPELTLAQKQSLSQIYETFRNENARHAPPAPDEPDEPRDEQDQLAAVMEDVAVVEDGAAPAPGGTTTKETT
jgi:hypothetical protein